MKEYIGSANLLTNLKFTAVGNLVPKEMMEKKTILEVVSDKQFNDLDVYIPHSKDEKLITPIPE